jgi:hypothetical protein
MKRILLATIVVGLLAVHANADTVTKEVTTTYTGTVSEIDPSASTIILKSESGSPTRYVVGTKTIYVDELGKTVTYEAVRGKPVTIYTARTGDEVVVEKVVVARPAAAGTTVHKETRTTVEHD